MAAEAVGTAFLLAIVVGSGIMAERLAGGNAALALLANALATGFGLAALIACLGPVSGAHFNPVVTLSLAARHEFAWNEVLPYVAVQVAAAAAGVVAAHLMFDEPFAFSTKPRSGPHQLWSEFVATFGLVLVVWACVRQRLAAAPAWISAYIAAAYWFTASTSFANPAVTLARCLTDTFAGVRPNDVPGFIVAQLSGAIAATAVSNRLFPAYPTQTDKIDL
ncbi:aquaporin [Usitatibacter rugosus]|uniref:aquaporin n=1 Tax=Usitatibacter rugosus TaxID=2732067 RepID=UPI001BB16481